VSERIVDAEVTSSELRELEAIADPAQRRAKRREQLEEHQAEHAATFGPACAHGVPGGERCFICDPLRLELFPPRDRTPTGNAP
jgi:hypothetical protein